MQNWRTSSIALVVLTFVWGGSVFAQTNDNRTADDNSPAIGYSPCQPGIEPPPQIPCTFWGIHVKTFLDPVQVPYGQWRAWDNGAQWPEIAPNTIQNYLLTDSHFDWKPLDNALAKILNQADVNDVLYTLSRTPPWAVTATQKNDMNCNYYEIREEFELLEHFLCHSGETLSRERLLDEVWGYENFPTTRTVDAHIVRIRQKLEPVPQEPRYFLTVHGVGYKFVG